MGILATENEQLILIYSKASRMGKKAFAYVKAIDKPKRLINIDKETVSKTVWLEIAELLNKDIADLFDTDAIVFKELNANKLSTDDWLKMIKQNTKLLQQPILIEGKQATIIKQLEDIYSYFETSGNGFNKSKEAIASGNHRADSY
ncbi:hypothetical protein GCM10022291_30580 [Postechiella marina]|uniref:Arsenate reductase, glutaredoxin family n=1 Tax=Postechiella marina TaxID=943941 RepID=A0ABP8CFV6_9FLAO